MIIQGESLDPFPPFIKLCKEVAELENMMTFSSAKLSSFSTLWCVCDGLFIPAWHLALHSNRRVMSLPDTFQSSIIFPFEFHSCLPLHPSILLQGAGTVLHNALSPSFQLVSLSTSSHKNCIFRSCGIKCTRAQ